MTSVKFGREYMAPPIEEEISGPGASTTTTGTANTPGAPTWVGNAEEQISIALDTNGNGSQVEYCIKVEVDGVDGGSIVQTDGTVAVTADVWQTAAQWGASIAVTGLSAATTPLPYRFAAKARNAVDAETAYGAWSAIMVPWLDLALGPLSSEVSYEVTTGNTKISSLSTSGTSNLITLTYTLTNKSATTSRVVVEYSPNNLDWYTATAGAGGDGITGLTAAAAGSSHTFIHASCTDLGNSAKRTVYYRITPYDASPSGGDAGTAATTSISLDNTPLAVTLASITIGAWDKDTTPIVMATMQSVVCGAYLYYFARAFNSAGAEIQTNSSAELVAGWEYETATNTWVAMTYLGVAAAYADGTNRVRYTFQTALSAGSTYTVKVGQAELKSDVYA